MKGPFIVWTYSYRSVFGHEVWTPRECETEAQAIEAFIEEKRNGIEVVVTNLSTVSIRITKAASKKEARNCLHCKSEFVARRIHQQFCSKSCQSTAAMRAYRLRNGLVTGRKPGRPRKLKEQNEGTECTEQHNRSNDRGGYAATDQQ